MGITGRITHATLNATLAVTLTGLVAAASSLAGQSMAADGYALPPNPSATCSAATSTSPDSIVSAPTAIIS